MGQASTGNQCQYAKPVCPSCTLSEVSAFYLTQKPGDQFMFAKTDSFFKLVHSNVVISLPNFHQLTGFVPSSILFFLKVHSQKKGNDVATNYKAKDKVNRQEQRPDAHTCVLTELHCAFYVFKLTTNIKIYCFLSSLAKSTDCSYRVPEFDSQKTHGGSQLPIMESDAHFWFVRKW